MSENIDRSARPRFFETFVYGGLAIGVLDFLDASIFFMIYARLSLARIWQSVAAGLLGRESAVAGGWTTAALGIFLHFVVAFLIAGVYYIGARNIAFLVRRPAISGLIFGTIANFVMQYAVIPLSAAGGWRPTSVSTAGLSKQCDRACPACRFAGGTDRTLVSHTRSSTRLEHDPVGRPFVVRDRDAGFGPEQRRPHLQGDLGRYAG